MHFAIALLFPLLLVLMPAGTPEASPAPTRGPLMIAAYPTSETPDIVSARDLDGHLEMRPGETWQLVIGTVECCYVFIPGDLDAIWTVSPVEGVSIDNDGLLTIGKDVPDGTVINVTANRDPVGPSASARVYVYTPEDQPLVGLWRETAQITCRTGEETTPEEPIGELRFGADGTFSITWYPFEIYVDYWGTYEADQTAGTLKLTITSGFGPSPGGFDGEGSFEIRKDGALVLRDIWLGSAPGSLAGVAGCGHVFDPL